MGRQGRWVDCLNAVGIARVPLVVIGALAGALRGPLLDAPEGPDVLVVVFAMTTLVMVAWFFTLLVTGFRAISGLRGARLVLTSIGVLFFAVLTSKLILSLAS